jgi:hypothetical protein
MRRYSENNRGVHMRCDVPAETEILSVGLDFLITVEMGRASPLGRRLAAAGIERELSASKHCYLVIFLLWDRRTNPGSPFQNYYKCLPDSYPNMPIFWDDEQLEWLRGSFVLQQVEDRRENIRADYEHICRAVGPEFAALASLAEFSWARMVVASRNFGIVVDGIRTDALVPYADMLNHSRPRQTRWLFDSRRRVFIIVSMQPLHVGAQVFDSYGKKCNSRFLLNYGFAVDHNADDDVGQNHNEVRLLIGLLPPRLDPWHARKRELLGGLPLVAPAAQRPAALEPLPRASAFAAAAAAAAAALDADEGGARKRGGSDHKSLAGDLAGDADVGGGGGGGGGGAAGGGSSNFAALDVMPQSAATPARAVRISTFLDYDGTVEAFSFLRFVHARSYELLHLPRMDEDFDLARRPVPPLSCANEAAALRQLRQLCEAQLAGYPTTLAQDRAALASGRHAYGSNRRNVLVLLVGEKEVLAHFVRLAELALPLLDAGAAAGAGAGAGAAGAPPQTLQQQVAAALSAALALKSRLALAGAGAPSGSDANAAKYVAAVVLPLLQKREASERQERAAALAQAAAAGLDGAKEYGS